jgi:hypothetical protein
MIRPVDAVQPALLMEAYKVVSENRESGDDHVVILVGLFGDRLEADTILSTSYRLLAFANVVKKDDVSPWVIHPKDKEYKLVNETLLRAAATAPLLIDDIKLVGEVEFDPASFTKQALLNPKPTVAREAAHLPLGAPTSGSVAIQVLLARVQFENLPRHLNRLSVKPRAGSGSFRRSLRSKIMSEIDG